MFRYRIAIIVCRGLLFEMKMKQVFPSYGTNTSFIALFPGHSCIQFLIACSMQTVSDQTLDGVKGLRTRLLELPSQFQCCVPVWGSLGLIWYELGNARDLQIKNVYTLVLLCYPFHKQLHIQLRWTHCVCTYSVQWMLHIWNRDYLVLDWKGECTSQTLYIYSNSKSSCGRM